MIVAITGGTGLIGRMLVSRHIARGDTVRMLSRRPATPSGQPGTLQHWQGDLANSGDLRPFVEAVDVLYHCAGEVRNTDLMQRVHVEGTRSLIDAAAGRIGRWVQLSSVGAYGRRRSGTVTEDTALDPRGTYETTKVQSDALVASRAAEGAFEHVILRPSNVYGTQMSNRSLFGLIAMVRRGLFFFIGGPGASANYIHADNVAAALLLCGTAPQASGRIYNLSDHRPMEQFVAVIANALGVDSPRLRLPEAPVRLLARLAGAVPGMPLSEARVDALTNRAVYASTRLEAELGYRHAVSMEEGIEELVDFWKAGRAQ